MSRLPGDPEFAVGFELGQELIDHERVLRHRLRVGVARQQIDVLVAQGQDAARFRADDRNPLLRVRRQQLDIPPRRPCGRRPPAPWRASAGRSRRAVPRSITSNPAASSSSTAAIPIRGIVVGGEGVVEVDDLAARLAGSGGRVCDAACQRVTKVLRWNGDILRSGARPSPASPARPAACVSARFASGAIGAPSFESVWMLPNTRARVGVPLALVVVRQELRLDLGHIDAGRTLGLAGLAGETEIHHLVGFLRGEILRCRRCRPASALRSALARPRVVSFSSLVAM